MINLGHYRRFNKNIKWVKDCPQYAYGKICRGKPIKPVMIKRYSQQLMFFPSIVFENRYLISEFEKPKNIIAKI